MKRVGIVLGVCIAFHIAFVWSLFHSWIFMAYVQIGWVASTILLLLNVGYFWIAVLADQQVRGWGGFAVAIAMPFAFVIVWWVIQSELHAFVDWIEWTQRDNVP